jgi:hypothetical protein
VTFSSRWSGSGLKLTSALAPNFLDMHQSHKISYLGNHTALFEQTIMDFEQAKKVLQVTDARIRKFGSIDTSTSREIREAIFKLQPL